MQINTYWFTYRDAGGNPQTGYIQGTDNFSAYRQAKAMYGNNMISEMVNLAPKYMKTS